MVGAKVRLPRPTNCANAPGGFSRCLGSAEEEFSRPISRLVVWGAGWGRKYAYLVLPTVLMPHGFRGKHRALYHLMGGSARGKSGGGGFFCAYDGCLAASACLCRHHAIPAIILAARNGNNEINPSLPRFSIRRIEAAAALRHQGIIPPPARFSSHRAGQAPRSPGARAGQGF